MNAPTVMKAKKPAAELQPCAQCLGLIGAGGGKQPHPLLASMNKYRAVSSKASSTTDFRCSACGFEWRHDRRSGWGRLGHGG